MRARHGRSVIRRKMERRAMLGARFGGVSLMRRVQAMLAFARTPCAGNGGNVGRRSAVCRSHATHIPTTRIARLTSRNSGVGKCLTLDTK